MQSIVRTAVGAYLQTCQLMGLPVVVAANTTLNEKLAINAAVPIASTDIPALRYVCIGNGGHSMVSGTGGFAVPSIVQHRPTDTALYNQLPFVLRLLTNDLTATQRANYRLRRTEVHGGQTYAAYYAKVLDVTNTVPQINYNTVLNGATTATPWAASTTNLNPTPPTISPTGVVVATGDYASASALVPFVMTADDVTEFNNVAAIIYGDPNYAIISEIALCSGVSKSVNGTFSTGIAAYTDALAVQVVSFANTFFAMQFTNTGINMLLELGASEPITVV